MAWATAVTITESRHYYKVCFLTFQQKDIVNPPPRPHTLYNRLRQIIPEQRNRPVRQAYLTGIIQRNLVKDLDLTMWDEEDLDEYE